MIRKSGICFLILFASLQAYAIDAVVSHSVFYLPDPAHSDQLLPNVETYWQINPRSLHYKTTPEKMIVAHIKTDIVFSNESGIIREDHFILQTIPCRTVKELMTHSIIDLRRHIIIPGNIKMTCTFTDLADSTHPFKYADSFTVAPISNTPFYSDVQLLDTVITSNAQSAFKKDGRQLIPACTNFIDSRKDTLRYYTELYNADKLSKDGAPFVQKIAILKKENDVPFTRYLKKDTITSGGNVMKILGGFDIASLTSGNYFLSVSLENGAHLVLASQMFFFQRLNTHPPKEDSAKKGVQIDDTAMENVNVLNLNKTFLAKYNLAEIRAILKMLLPMSDAAGAQTIKGFLKKPEEMYMRYYIYNYFASIDKKDPGRAWKAYSEKIKDVNKRFTAYHINGYETDRGFMYLRYGAPTEVVTVENDPGTLPYEIWQYNTLTQLNHKDIANAVFLFYKPNEMTDFRLLHCTVSGEAQNISWRTYLYISDQAGNNINSRAEQYLGNR